MASNVTRDHHLWTRDTIKNVSGDITLDVAGDITLDAGGSDIKLYKTTNLSFSQSSNDWVITNALNDADIIFNSLSSSSPQEVMRIDASARSLLISSGRKIEFGDAGEYISGDGTDIHFGVGAGGDINIPAQIGLTFGADTEKIEADGSNNLELDAGGNITLDAAAGDITLNAKNLNIPLSSTLAADRMTIDRDISSISAGTFVGLEIDFDKTGSSTATTELKALDIVSDCTTHTGGANLSYGVYSICTLTYASDLGTPVSIGGFFKANGGSNGTSTAVGVEALAFDADTCIGLRTSVTNGQTDIKMTSSASNIDFCTISTGAAGATTIATIDGSGGNDAGNITLDAEGAIYIGGTGTTQLRKTGTAGLTFLEASSNYTIFNIIADKDIIFADHSITEVCRIDGSEGAFKMASGKELQLGAAQEYIKGDGTDIHFGVGAGGDINIPADIGLTFGDDGEKIEGDGTNLTIASSGHVEFDGCGVGFDKETATFSTSPIDSDANDSTDVDFRLGNKFELTLTDDISGSSEFINLIFPATSGNFILVLIQGVADCTVAAAGWLAYQSDGSTPALNNAGNNQADGRVRWAGGSAPTLSTTQYDVDIISFYWDADNETAFAVASLGF